MKISLKDDERSFRELYDYYYPRLLRFAFNLVKSDDIAKEVISDVFIKIWNNREKLVEIEQLDFYFYKAVRNQSLTYLVKKRQLYDDLETLPDSQIITYQNPENKMLSEELLDRLEQSIASLPAKCQMIFRLSREDGLVFKEIAKVLEISENTVKNQVTRALKRIKSDFSDYFDS